MRRDLVNGQAVKPSKFYLVTLFWNLKRVLAPRTRCYYHGHAHAHYHLTRAQIGSRIAGRPSRRQTAGVKAPRSGDQRPGGGSQACHRKLGPLGQDLAPLTATTLRAIHVGQESDQ